VAAKKKKTSRLQVAEVEDMYIPVEGLGIGYTLIPEAGHDEEALVYQIGAEKHGAESWREGIPWSKALSKMQRHLGKFLAGESRCPVDGQHHLGSVKFWCNALMEYEQTHPELDDIRG
jgi:dATP/dGTP diphosphohydrolase